MTVCGLITKLIHRLIYLFCLGKWSGVLEAQGFPAWKLPACKSFVNVMKKYSPHFHPLVFTLLNKNESFCSKHAQKGLNVAFRAAHKLTMLLLRVVQISKSHVQGVQNFCFSSLNIQMCNVLFAVVSMVTCVPHYSSVKLSWALLAVITVPKTCAYISF